jgi:hypothetical protein
VNYGELQSRLLSLIGRAPASVCYELVTADINRELRLKVMQSTTTLTAAEEITLPSDFLEVVDAYVDTTPRRRLIPTTEQVIHDTYTAGSIPRMYAIVDGKMLLSPEGASESIELRYIAKLADLDADSDENDILTTYPDIYIYGTLAHHALTIGDPRAGQWGPLYEAAKMKATAHDARQTFANTPIQPVADYVTP